MLRSKDQGDRASHVLVHFHIFKNGGTSFDHALKREFGRAFAEFDGDKPMHVHHPDEIADYLRAHPKVAALSSHHLRFPLPEMEEVQLLPAFFLRHPMDRMHSIYRYERKQRSSSPGSQHAKKYDFPDYVRWRLDQGKVNLLCNFHTAVLSCNRRLGNKRPDLELAKANLEAATLCGLVERMEESLAVGEARLRAWFPDLDLATTPQNVAAGRASTLEERLEQSEQACGSALYADVLSRNHLDLQLYAAAEEVLERRIAELQDRESVLSGFRDRCRRLA